MADFLDDKRREISDRMRELKPAVDEYNRLEAAAAALAAVRGSRAATATTRSRRQGRPRGSATRAKAAGGSATTTKARRKPGRPPGRRRAGRPKGSGTRAAQALSLVQEQPGITIPQLAAKMGIKQNYLYRVLPGLEQQGKIAKQGRGWRVQGWDPEGP